MTTNKDILIDADVVSHFLVAGEARLLNKIFPKNRIYLLDKVHAELQKWPPPSRRTEVSFLLNNGILTLLSFPEDDPMISKEYAWIKSKMFKGEGESACLAVARFSKNILASSNLRDIAAYCKMHKIDYLTTMDFLCEALRTGLFTTKRCDEFIGRVLKAGSKLPAKMMSEYNCKQKEI